MRRDGGNEERAGNVSCVPESSISVPFRPACQPDESLKEWCCFFLSLVVLISIVQDKCLKVSVSK